VGSISGGSSPNARTRTLRPYAPARAAADAVEGTDDRLERRRVDRLVHADAPGDDVGAARLDVGDSGGVGASRHGVLRVVDHFELDAEVGLDGVDEGGDGAVAATRDRAMLAVDQELGRDARALLA